MQGATPWDNLSLPFSLPRQFVVMVGDVASGASTPVMVSKLLQWRKENVENKASVLWEQLVAGHTESSNLIRQLSERERQNPEIFSRAVSLLSPQPATSWGLITQENNNALDEDMRSLISLFLSIRERYESLRSVVRNISGLSSVPIEPTSLTPLLDATSSLPGVLISGCPGAGGEDAIFSIAIGESVVEKVEKLWREWNGNGLNVCALNVNEGKGGVQLDTLPSGYTLEI